MLSGARGRQMPFDVGCSGHERDIVQVDDLPSRSMGAIDSRKESG